MLAVHVSMDRASSYAYSQHDLFSPRFPKDSNFSLTLVGDEEASTSMQM